MIENIPIFDPIILENMATRIEHIWLLVKGITAYVILRDVVPPIMAELVPWLKQKRQKMEEQETKENKNPFIEEDEELEYV